MKLAEKILCLRKQHNMSQEELAERLNVSRQAVSRWEVGSAQPDASNVLQLSRLFGVTADYLLNDSYESDGDVPAVKNVEMNANRKIRKIIAMGVSAIGLSGNFIFYLLSRFIKVPVPLTMYLDDVKTYVWEMYEEYSYPYFIKTYKLEFLTAVFWLLFVGGILYAFIHSDKRKAVTIHRKNRKKDDKKS